jgi:DNA-binding NarL/FixJ family response regulator
MNEPIKLVWGMSWKGITESLFVPAYEKHFKKQGFNFSGYAKSEEELLKKIETDMPDVILLDLEIEWGTHVKNIFNHILKQYPHIKIIIITTSYLECLEITYKRWGASEYLVMNNFGDEYINLTQAILNTKFIKENYKSIPRYDGYSEYTNVDLTDKELELIPLLMDEMKSVNIAEKLNISKADLLKLRDGLHDKLKIESDLKIITEWFDLRFLYDKPKTWKSR